MHHEYIIDGLDCAGCAAKIERAIIEHESVEDASLSFATKRLYIDSALGDDEVLAIAQGIADSIEDGVKLISAKAGATENGEHSHESNAEKRSEHITIVTLCAAVVAVVVGMLCFEAGSAMHITLLVLAILLAGHKVIWSGIKSLVRLNFNESALMTVAMVAACILGEYFEAAMVAMLFCIGEILEDKACEKARASIEALADMRPDTAIVVENGESRQVRAQDVALGSTIRINPHERVPLDCTVTVGESEADLSAITGEGLAVEVGPGNELPGGSMNGEGELLALVTARYEDSAASRIIAMVTEASANKGESEKFIARFARVYTPIVMVLALLVGILPPLLFQLEWNEWIMRALTFLVASCPCAIVISVPLCFFASIGGASRIGVLVKGARYIESAARAKAAAFDKTGTLTLGKIQIGSVNLCGDADKDEAVALAAACEAGSAHPLAKAVLEYAQEHSIDYTSYEVNARREISARGIECQINGQQILCGGMRLMNERAIDTHGLSGEIMLVRDGQLLAAFLATDTPSPDSSEVLSQMEALGFTSINMLTGDNRESALRTAGQLGIARENCHYELLPEDKAKIVEDIRSSNGEIIFCGDGINDAPVMCVADCAVAMGLGSSAAIEAADMVLSGGTLAPLPRAIRHFRRTMRTVRGCIVLALAVKAAVMILAAFGAAPMWAAVLADVGTTLVAVIIAMSLLKVRK